MFNSGGGGITMNTSGVDMHWIYQELKLDLLSFV